MSECVVPRGTAEASGSPCLDVPPRSRDKAALDIATKALCAIVSSDSARRHFEIARQAIRDIETLRQIP